MILELKTSGQVKKAPTQIIFSLSFKEKSKDYSEVINKGASQIVEFKEILKKLKINEDNFKTLSYNISTINNRVEENKGFIDKEKTVKYVFSHYEITQTAKLNIDFDMEKMLNLMSLIAKMKKYPTYSFNFSIKDEERAELENKALEIAIKLANEKAEAIKKATNKDEYNMTDLSIVEHFQSYDNYRYSKTSMRSMECALNSVDIGELSQTITPEDISVEINIITKFNIS